MSVAKKKTTRARKRKRRVRDRGFVRYNPPPYDAKCIACGRGCHKAECIAGPRCYSCGEARESIATKVVVELAHVRGLRPLALARRAYGIATAMEKMRKGGVPR